MAFSKLNYIQTLDNDLNDINSNVLSLRIFILRLIEKIEKRKEINDFIKFYEKTEKALADFYSFHGNNINELNLQEKIRYKIDFQKIETLYLNVIYVFDQYLTARDNNNHKKFITKQLPYADDFKALAVFYVLFETVIHLNVSINDNDKLFYLKTSLVGSAIDLINYPCITYNAAWDIITKNYNERCSAENKSYAKLITDISFIDDRSSLENLRKLWKRVQIYLKLLENLNRTSFRCYTLFTLFIISKFDEITKNNWNIYLNNRQSTLEEIEKFLSLHFDCKQKESMDTDNENTLLIGKLSEINDQQNGNSAENGEIQYYDDENPINVENDVNSSLNEYLVTISASLNEICTTLVDMKDARLLKKNAAQIRKLELQSVSQKLETDGNSKPSHIFHDNSAPSTFYYDCFQVNEKISETNTRENELQFGSISDFANSDRKNDENKSDQLILNEIFQRNIETTQIDLNFPSGFETNDEDTNKEKFGINKTLHSDVEVKNLYLGSPYGATEEDYTNQRGINNVMQSDTIKMNPNLGHPSIFVINNEKQTANQICLNESMHPNIEKQKFNARFSSDFPTNEIDSIANYRKFLNLFPSQEYATIINQFGINNDNQQNFPNELNPLQGYSGNVKDDKDEFQSIIVRSSMAESAPPVPNQPKESCYLRFQDIPTARRSSISVQEEDGCCYSLYEKNCGRNLAPCWIKFIYYTFVLIVVIGVIYMVR